MGKVVYATGIDYPVEVLDAVPEMLVLRHSKIGDE